MATEEYFMPAEWQSHSSIIMVWPGLEAHDYWPPGNYKHIIVDVTRVAQAIASFEQVTMYVAQSQVDEARNMLQNKTGAIELRVIEGEEDLKPWARDTAPTFVVGRQAENAGVIRGINFHFNGWGDKDRSASNRRLAKHIMEDLRVVEHPTSLVAEGGAIETDGSGTLMVTASSLISEQRNPGMDRAAINQELKRVLGVEAVIWLSGVSGADTTDCHVDALARFAAPGVVVLSRPPATRPVAWRLAFEDARRVLEDSLDAEGRLLRVVDIPEPDISGMEDANPEMIPSYVNYFHMADAMIVPQFGYPETDCAAIRILSEKSQKRS